MLLVFLNFAVGLGEILKFGLCISPSTPSSYISKLNSLSSSSTLYHFDVFSLMNSSSDSLLSSYSLLVDFTYSSILSSELRRISTTYNIPLICTQNCELSSSDAIFQIFPTCSQIFLALNQTLNKLNWTNYAVFYDNSDCSTLLSTMLNAKENYFSFSETDLVISNLISKKLKASGIKQWVILTEENTSAYIEKNLRLSKLIKAGTGVVAGPFSYFGLQENGALAVVKKGFQDEKDSVSFTVDYLQSALVNITKYSEDSILTITEALSNFVKNSAEFSVYNLLSTGWNEVFALNCNLNCKEIKDILYFGATYIAPLDSITNIPISLSAGILDPSKSAQISNNNFYAGSILAINYYNNLPGFLSSFRFLYKNTSCFSGIFSFNSSCYDQYSRDLGLFHISPHFDEYVISLYSYLSNYSINIFGSSDGLVLADKNSYPLYISTGVPLQYQIVALLRVLSIYGFDKFAIMSDSNEENLDWINDAIQFSFYNGMEVLNDLNNYILNTNPDGTIAGNLSVFENVINSRARIIVIACAAKVLNNVLKKFNELGMEQGDLFFAARILSVNVLVNLSDPDYPLRQMFIPGLLSIFPANFIGDLGAQVRSNLTKIIGPPSFIACYFFDSFALGYYAVQNLIITGKDYEDYLLLNTEARKVRFTGCAGSIKIVDYTNLRESELYTVNQMGYNGSNLASQLLAYYYPSGSIGFKVVQQPNWTTPETPSVLRVVTWNCPFNPKLLKPFYKGQVLVGVLCALISFFTVINTVIIWKKYWDIDVKDLEKREEISFQDSVAMLTVLIELTQVSAMGPDFSGLWSLFVVISSVFSYNIEKFVSLKDGVFWYILLSILISVTYWVLLCVVWVFRLQEKFSGFWLFRFFGWSIINLMPILGNLMFIPIISTLVDVFLCDSSIDGTFGGSILDKDCFQRCWDSRHIPYAVVSGLYLIMYQPLAVYFRPFYQEFLPLLHVKSLPRYLMFKSAYQVVLVVLNKTVKRTSPEIHSIVYLIVITAYTVGINLKKTYNYHRIRLWHRLGSIGIITLALGSVINEYGVFFPYLWVSLVFSSWAVLLVVGLVVQYKKYPSLLYRPPSKDIAMLFRWMFNLETSESVFKSQIYIDHSEDQGSLDMMVVHNLPES